ncbi:MAG TPA: hypothetical protein VMS31_04115 [Pyrinomonadaceae bacterium]|nr:hypothetical protein [Pyrinomonadaceae bacterium]
MTSKERLALILVKIERAKKHLADLRTAHDEFIRSEPYSVGRKPNPEPGYENFYLFFMSRIDPVPNDISALAGDAIHNLRSALDHLACQLVVANGRSISDRTAFPIFKGLVIHEASFDRQVEGMSQSAKDKVRSAEPYKDGKGHDLWVLHKLDIADKHNGLLTTLSRVGEIRLEFDTGYWQYDYSSRRPQFAAPGFGEPLEVGNPFYTCDRGTENKTQIDFEIALSEPGILKGKPVVWSVNRLIETCEALILDFEPLLG